VDTGSVTNISEVRVASILKVEANKVQKCLYEFMRDPEVDGFELCPVHANRNSGKIKKHPSLGACNAPKALAYGVPNLLTSTLKMKSACASETPATVSTSIRCEAQEQNQHQQ
jgi:hypothetical protein